MAREIKVLFLGDASDLNRATSSASRDLEGFAKHAGVIGGLVSAGVTAGINALTSLTTRSVGFLKESIDAAEAFASTAHVTAQLVAQTGASSFTSAAQLGAFAKQLSNVTGTQAVMIQQAENVLLTFRNVRNEAGRGNDIFNRATTVALDMSKVLGQDLTKSNIQLGKALADPIKGLTALRRVGVIFTQQQQDQIKALVAHNDLLDAQKLILAEVEHEFGGAAEAGATAGEKFNAAFTNLKESIGELLLPAFEGLVGFLINTGFPAVQTFAENLKTVIGDVVTHAKSFGADIMAGIRAGLSGHMTFDASSLKGIATTLGEILGGLAKAFDDAKAAIVAFGRDAQPTLDTLARWADEHAAGVKVAADALAAFAASFLLVVGAAQALASLGSILGFFAKAVGLLVAALGGTTAIVIALVVAAVVALGLAVYLAYQRFKGLHDFVQTMWEDIQAAAEATARFFVRVWEAVAPALAAAFHVIKTTITTVIDVVRAVVEAIPGIFASVAGAVSTAFDAVSSAVSTSLSAIADVARPVISFLQGLWAQYGDEVTGILIDFRDIVLATFRFFRDTAERAINAVIAVFQFLEPILAPIIEGFIKFVTILAREAVPVLEFIGQVFAATFDLIESAVRAFVQFVTPIWTATWHLILDVVKNVIGPLRNIFEGVLRVVQGFFDIIAGLFTGDWSRMWDGVKNIVSGAWEFITNIFAEAIGILEAVLSNLLDIITAPFRGAFDAAQTELSGLWQFVVGIFQGIIDFLTSSWANVVDFITNPFTTAWAVLTATLGQAGGLITGIFQGVIDWFANTWSTVEGLVTAPLSSAWDWITSTFTTVKDTVAGWFQALIDWFTNTWSTVEDKITAPFKNAWDWITTTFANVKQWVEDHAFTPMKQAWNGIANWWNSHNGISWGGFSIGDQTIIPGFNIKLPDLPTFPMAMGGIAMSPLLALLAERGQGEAVIPLDRLHEFMPAPGPAVVVNHRQTINAGFGTDRFALQKAVRKGNHQLQRLAGVRA